MVFAIVYFQGFHINRRFKCLIFHRHQKSDGSDKICRRCRKNRACFKRPNTEISEDVAASKNAVARRTTERQEY